MNRITCFWGWTAAALLSLACASKAPQGKSTGTNWLGCRVDADCARVAGARCRHDDVCIDRAGKPIPADAVSSALDGGAADAGPAAGGGAAGHDGSTPSHDGSTPSHDGSPAPAGSGGRSGHADAGNAGRAANGVGSGGSPPRSGDANCYSPGQNLDKAYEDSAQGCPCASPTLSLCARGGSTNVALVCEGGYWRAVLDGPCGACWTPDEPEHMLADPANGCACEAGQKNERVCLYTTASGFMSAVCDGQKWTFGGLTDESCRCESDARCGFGGKCTDGICAFAACEVFGVRYAVGATVPDPFSCNHCTCGNIGGLSSCTEISCPLECPERTTAGMTCVECGVLACAVTRTGCLQSCETTDECTVGYCDRRTHTCLFPGCL